MFGLVLQHDRKAHIEFQVNLLKVKVIMNHKQSIMSSAIAMNIFNVVFLLHITVDEKREPHVKF